MAPQEPKARTVSVYNTVGSCELEFSSKANTWGELKKELTGKNVQHNQMKAVIGENQQELKEDSDILITQDLSLFLTPIRVKSGN